MKRLISAFACMLALLIWPCTSAQARFLGTLQQNVPWTLEVNTDPSCPGATAVTVTFVNSRGRQNIDLFTVQPGAGAVSVPAIPRNTRRIIIEVDLPCSFGLGFVTVQQGANTIDRDFCTDGFGGSCADRRFVFDVVDAP